MRRFLVLLGLAAAFHNPIPALAQSPGAALTLDEALARAAARSPAVTAARRNVEAAEGAIRQAGAGRNPTLHASVEDFRGATRTTTATLDLPLEFAGKRSARVVAAERARDVALAEAARARAQVRGDVAAAYFDVLVAQERGKVAASSVDLARRGADVAARRVAAGKVSPVEETRAGVDLANARLEAAEAAARLQAARQALAAALGDLEPRFGEVSGATAMPERPPVAQLLARLDAAPALQASRSEVDRRLALVAVERTRALGDVTLSVGAKRDNELGRTQAVVGVSVPLPLVDDNEGAIHEAARLADRAEDELQATRLRLASELQQASGRLAVARTVAATLQDAVLPAAQDAWQAATTGFEAGKFSFLEVLDAQRALLAARNRYLASLAEAHEAASAIDRILGE